MRKFINFIKNLFKKKSKPEQCEEKEIVEEEKVEKEIVASGYVSAGDFLCIRKEKGSYQ